MLQALGFSERMQIRKKWDIYFPQHSHITLDDIGGLGLSKAEKFTHRIASKRTPSPKRDVKL
ncbi:hypothetical protein [Litoreibacter roseus]|uniref:Uncharacterized protein n=1 Tax=Litoreibacter roseus TaxID=2601869 RepID=A0A6N6JEU8_9RHOB|nr:hypothetical protein [Litoreibacter roseus]GFE63742.1 hypothetical protein KIN_08160 [Litoreibacter roseus]